MLFYATSFFVYKDRNIFYINSSYSHIVIWYFISVDVSEQHRNNNSVRQYNQLQTGQVVGLSDDKWATLDIRQYGPRVVWERKRG
jgi:hypothetical protein